MIRHENPIALGYFLRGSVEGIQYIHELQFKRDYAEYFIEWISKRYPYFITTKFLSNVWSHVARKHGVGLARNGPQRPIGLNSRFGLEASGDFCAVSVYDSKPIYGEKCKTCNTVTKGEVTRVGSVFDLVYLTNHPQILFDSCVIDFEPVHAHFKSQLRSTGLCQDPDCIELHDWLNKDDDSTDEAKRLSVPVNKPRDYTISIQSPYFIKPFIAARYLDFKARLQIAKDKLNH